MQKSIQCAVVGDGFVGKSSLVQKFVNGKFDKTYIATLKDDYSAKVSTNGDVFRLNVSDIAGEVSRSYFYIFRKRCSSAYHFLIDVLCIIHYFYCLFFVLQHEDLSSIATSDIFIVCFSLVDDDSMYSVLNFWIPKIRAIAKHSPIILAGTQSDLRQGGQSGHIATAEGRALAKSIGADTYVECSAKSGSGVQETFQSAAMASIRYSKRKVNILKRVLGR